MLFFAPYDAAPKVLPALFLPLPLSPFRCVAAALLFFSQRLPAMLTGRRPMQLPPFSLRRAASDVSFFRGFRRHIDISPLSPLYAISRFH
jgi:hypothetical protein